MDVESKLPGPSTAQWQLKWASVLYAAVLPVSTHMFMRFQAYARCIYSVLMHDDLHAGMARTIKCTTSTSISSRAIRTRNSRTLSPRATCHSPSSDGKCMLNGRWSRRVCRREEKFNIIIINVYRTNKLNYEALRVLSAVWHVAVRWYLAGVTIEAFAEDAGRLNTQTVHCRVVVVQRARNIRRSSARCTHYGPHATACTQKYARSTSDST